MLTLSRLQELLSYDPASGTFTWLAHRNSGATVGDLAGSLNTDGYVVIGIDGKIYSGHRLAWFYQTGSWPKNEIDHVNHVRSDNRWSNLREETRQGNLMNKAKSKRNSSGHSGVYKTTAGNWIARICIQRKQVNLGTFATIADAVSARQAALRQHNFHPNHGL